jgi:hypothetical protein
MMINKIGVPVASGEMRVLPALLLPSTADETSKQLLLPLMQYLYQVGTPVSLARLAKQLGVRHSSLLRCLAYLGHDTIGNVAGMGWVSVQQAGERQLIVLTEQGQAVCGVKA